MKKNHWCNRCNVTITAELLDIPNRCPDTRCPLMSDGARMERAKELGAIADRAVEDRAKRKSLNGWKGSQLPRSWEGWH